MSNFSAILFRIKERTLPESAMARAVKLLTVTSFVTTVPDGPFAKNTGSAAGLGQLSTRWPIFWQRVHFFRRSGFGHFGAIWPLSRQLKQNAPLRFALSETDDSLVFAGLFSLLAAAVRLQASFV